MSDEKKQEAAQNEPAAQKPVRPNAGYGLSVKNQNEKELTFYYSRENRLAKAPQDVRDLYAQKPEKHRFNLIGPLIGSKSRTLLFSSILLLLAIIMALSIFTPSGAYDLDGNRVTVQAVKYESAIIAVVKKTLPKNRRGKYSAGSAYTGAVDLGASPVLKSSDTSTPDVFLHRIFFTADDAEEFRFALPFEADAILMVFQTETGQVSIQVKVE